jgi:hypothetical protein
MPAERTSFAASLLAQRPLCLALTAAAVAHLAANAVGLPGWVCPWKAATGIPCPGCGLTRATIHLVRGDVAGALHLHPFAPVAVAGIALIVAAAILPAPPRNRLVQAVARVDPGGLTSMVLLAALIAVWLLKLALDFR